MQCVQFDWSRQRKLWWAQTILLALVVIVGVIQLCQ